jgi:hypothetical protein
MVLVIQVRVIIVRVALLPSSVSRGKRLLLKPGSSLDLVQES